MAFALLGNAQIAGAVNGGTSAGVDTTGASLLVVHASWYGLGGSTSISDSKGNTWNALTARADGFVTKSQIFYAKNPTVGSGHTFTFSGTGIYAVTQVEWFSGADTSAPFDVENGSAGASTTTRQPGSVTPSQNDSLIVAGLSVNGNTGTYSVNSSFTITNQSPLIGGTAEGGALAYLIQTTAGAVNPQWSWTNSDYSSATIAVFKPASGATTHAATGALVGAGSTIAGSAAHIAKHATSGALTGPGSSIVGSAARTRAHPSSGALVGPGAVIVGAAVHLRPHATSGDLVGPGSAIAGAADHTVPGGTHDTSGALTGQGAVIAGSAAHIAVHGTSGALTGPGAVIAGDAARVAAAVSHDASGALVGPGAVVAGSASLPSVVPDSPRHGAWGAPLSQDKLRQMELESEAEMIEIIAMLCGAGVIA